MKLTMKQVLSLLPALAMAACGREEDTLSQPDTQLDADAILTNPTRTPAMFFGYTTGKPFEKAMEKFTNGIA